MAIYISGTRDKGNEFFKDCPARHEVSIDEALIALLKYELGYGGVVSQVTETSLTVHTRVMHCLDTMIFEADTKEEIEPLHAAIYDTGARLWIMRMRQSLGSCLFLKVRIPSSSRIWLQCFWVSLG